MRGRKGDLSYSSPIIAGDIAVVVGGFNGPSLGFQPGGSGDITDSRRIWTQEPNPQNIGSGVHVNGAVFVPDAGPGLLRCLDPKTGELRWRERTDANFWGSIVKAGNRLYVTDQLGKTVVFAPNPELFEQIAVNPLNEPSNSTPAIAHGQIYIRTVEALYCIAEE